LEFNGDRAAKTALTEVKERKMQNPVHHSFPRRGGLVRRLCLALFLLELVSRSATAQWLHYPSPGIPRTPDGKPNLSAPVPKGPDGKPDLYGLWELDRTRPAPFDAAPDAAPGIAIKPEDIVLTSEGEALQRQRKKNYFPGAQCLPEPLPRRYGAHPFKILTLGGLVVILYESQTTYRQIFMDGRELPKDPNPAWAGYSVGKWDGDTLVVDTSGFNDDEWILPGRRPHSDALHIIERFRRPDFGHLEIQFTIDDPKVYAKPWTIKQNHHLLLDTDLLEYICNENEKDLKHMVGPNR